MKKSHFLTFVFSFLFAFSLYAKQEMSVMYIGDSHSYGKLGSVINKNLSERFSNVTSQAGCGATAKTWLGVGGFEKTVCGYWLKDVEGEIRSKAHQIPFFGDELKKYNPDIVIVQLGTNMAAANKPLHSKQSVIDLITMIQEFGAKCIWIGPPDANSKIVTKQKVGVVNQMLKEVTTKLGCYYIDSLEVTSFPENNKEGIHYPNSLSAKWGEDVSAILLDYLD